MWEYSYLTSNIYIYIFLFPIAILFILNEYDSLYSIIVFLFNTWKQERKQASPALSIFLRLVFFTHYLVQFFYRLFFFIAQSSSISSYFLDDDDWTARSFFRFTLSISLFFFFFLSFFFFSLSTISPLACLHACIDVWKHQ